MKDTTKLSRKLIATIVVILLMASCADGYLCPSYGDSKRATSHGKKNQSRYAKSHR